MLSQALDRVLGVVRLPGGSALICIQGPALRSDHPHPFCRRDSAMIFAARRRTKGLDDYLVNLVSRLGGLLGFRDLRDDSLSALEKEQSIRRFRDLALAQGLRSVVAISLQSERASLWRPAPRHARQSADSLPPNCGFS